MNMINHLLVFIIIFWLVEATKRSRNEYESRSTTYTYHRSDLKELIESLAGRSGSKCGHLHSGVISDLTRHVVALGVIDIEQFEAILNDDDFDSTMTSSSDSSDHGSDSSSETTSLSSSNDVIVWSQLHNQLWRKHILDTDMTQASIGYSNDLREFLTRHAKIKSVLERQVIALSQRAWDLLVYPFLHAQISNHDAYMNHYRMKVVSVWPNLSTWSSSNKLPRIALEYMIQRLNMENGLDILQIQLELFDPSALLTKRMVDFFMHIKSMQKIDSVVYEHLDETTCAIDHSQLANQINSLFNETTNVPIYKILYSAERIGFWCNTILAPTRFNKKLLEDSKKVFWSDEREYVRLDWHEYRESILLLTKIPSNPKVVITRDDVLVEWEKYERRDAPYVVAGSHVTTGITRLPFNSEFQIPMRGAGKICCDSFMGEIVGENVSVEAKRAVLEHLLDEKLGFDLELGSERFMIPIAKQFNANITELMDYAEFIKGARFASRFIAGELCRINRRKINTDITAVIHRAFREDPEYTKTIPLQVDGFYKILTATVAGNRYNSPITLVRYKGRDVVSVGTTRVWQTAFVEPLLASLH